MNKIAYITSGKIGIHSFTYNEINELEKESNRIVLCLTQLNPGPYMPSDNWEILIASKHILIIPLLKLLLRHPKKFANLFKKAIASKAIPYFFIAVFFYDRLRNITSIHCQMGDKKLFIGYFLKKLLNRPLTVTIHAHELYQRAVYDNPDIIRELLNSCEKIVTISDFNKAVLRKEIGIKENRIEVMRLYPDIDRVNKIAGKTRILTVANWAEKKGYRTLINAVEKIQRDDFVLIVVGGSYFSDNSIDLVKIIAQRKLEDKVLLLGRFGGQLLDIVFAGCDVFCLPSITEYYEDGKPSEREGIPVAIMEAMAWGKPVISTRHAGIPELLDEILVEENDTEGLIKAINYMLDHPEKWESMGKKNRTIINNRYTAENIKQLSKIFNALEKN